MARRRSARVIPVSSQAAAQADRLTGPGARSRLNQSVRLWVTCCSAVSRDCVVCATARSVIFFLLQTRTVVRGLRPVRAGADHPRGG